MAKLLLDSKTTVVNTPPETTSSNNQYTSQNSVRFLLNIPKDKEIVKDSFWLAADLFITYNGAPVNPEATPMAYYDNFSGYHAFLDTITTNIRGKDYENFTGYGRFMKMKTMNEKNTTQLGMNLKDNCEGRLQDFHQSTFVMVGKTQETNLNSLPLLISPYCAFNRTNRNITSADLSPNMEIKINLSEDRNVFFGKDSAALSYYLSNPRLYYKIQPLQPTTVGPLIFGHINHGEYKITSINNNIEIKVPNVCSSLSMSVALEANTIQNNAAAYDQDTSGRLATNYINLDYVEFKFDDENNTLYTYRLDTLSEIYMAYNNSFNKLPNNKLSDNSSLVNVNTKLKYPMSNFGIGLNFMNAIPIGTKIGATLQVSDDETQVPTMTSPWIVYIYFWGQVAL